MKKFGLFASIVALGIGFTSCPSTVTSDLAQPSNEFQIRVSPAQLNLAANSSAKITVQLEHPAQAHQSILVQLVNLPSGVTAQAITIPSNASQVELEIKTTTSFQTATASVITVQGHSSQTKSFTTFKIMESKIVNDGSNIRAVFSGSSDSNANLSAFQSQIGYANFKGSQCQMMTSDHKRSILICLSAPYLAGKTYQLVKNKDFGGIGTASITYFEQSATTSTANAAGAFWDSQSGTLTLNQISSSVIDFQVNKANMVAADGFAKNTASNGFQLEIDGHIEDISNL
jgi:hypothetical protein